MFFVSVFSPRLSTFSLSLYSTRLIGMANHLYCQIIVSLVCSAQNNSRHPELRHIDQTTLKHCHTAATTFILEGVKQNADKSTISSCLEDVRFQNERVDTFYNSFQKHKKNLESLLSSTDTCPPHITDAEWRLEYCIKNSHVHKVNQPSYLISLNTERAGASSEINFSCTMDQLQDLVGKMKDAAKSLERATQS
uniref:COMM domain-containing protein 3 n=1 Tax=Cyprinus carpio TaxID=7962 RepID=A0A8C1U423_CYPCA